MSGFLAPGRRVRQTGNRQAGHDRRVSRRTMLRSVVGTGLAAACFTRAPAAEPATVQELFEDPLFARGFGAAWPYGERFSGGPREGTLLAYRDISPYQVHLIPEGAIGPADTRFHAWDFEEGVHRNFTDCQGLEVDELHEHRLAVNHVVETNTAERLQFAQFNNYRLAPEDPQRNQKLVKRVTSDRRGNLRMYYNSTHEIRNAALAYLPAWARDTWPHFLLVQRFPKKPRLSDFRRLEFSVTTQVNMLESQSDWPAPVSGGTPPEMNLLCYFLLHDERRRPLWVGLLLHSSQLHNYFTHTAREQHAMAFYREPMGTPSDPPALGRRHIAARDLKTLVDHAVAAVAAKFGSEESFDPHELRLVLFNIGWEGIGHWQCECELSGLTLRGDS